MSVVSYTDVCVIDVAAELMFIAAAVAYGAGWGWGGAESVICTRCHNGRVCRGGRCGGHHLRGRRGD